jgi:hypothetical protein
VNYANVAAEIAARLRSISGLNIHQHPVGSASFPAAIVSWPERVDYDGTYRRGMDTMTIPVLLLVAESSDALSTQRALSGYLAGAGATSIKAAIENAGSASGVFSTVVVKDSTVDPVTLAGVDCLAAKFTVEITGSGTA